MTQKNIDQAEIAQFSAFAKEWWDEDGPMKPLHALNPVRLAYVEKQVALKDKKILDLGCGGGIFSEAMAKAGALVTGLDMSGDVITVAKTHAELASLDIHYEQVASEEFAAAHAGQFDVVTCMEMLEHVPDPIAIIADAAKLTAPNGWVFFSTINRTMKAFLLAIVGAEYVLNLLPKNTHHYEKFIRPSELTRAAESNQLVFQNAQGMTYSLSKKNWALADSVDVNYMIAFRKT